MQKFQPKMEHRWLAALFAWIPSSMRNALDRQLIHSYKHPLLAKEKQQFCHTRGYVLSLHVRSAQLARRLSASGQCLFCWQCYWYVLQWAFLDWDQTVTSLA